MLFAQVPGLFEGDEHTTLMTQCKEGAQREGLMLDSNEELYKWFTHQVSHQLVVLLFKISVLSIERIENKNKLPKLFNFERHVLYCNCECYVLKFHTFQYFISVQGLFHFYFIYMNRVRSKMFTKICKFMFCLGDEKSSCCVHHEP